MNDKLINDDVVDAAADEQIAKCLDKNSLASFFLFAGAGSGKTGSLIRSLRFLQISQGDRLQLHGQRIAVITYTNKARDEIKERLGHHPVFYVSTVHSFAWSLIDGCNFDIREYLRSSLAADIQKLEADQLKGRAGQASIDRGLKIVSKTKRLAQLDTIKIFEYSPDSDNTTRDSLNHSEVIKIASDFLSKSVVRDIFTNRFKILLIDECQDTNKLLIESLIEVQQDRKNSFVLGLFGDMMQRIYNDGKSDLDCTLPKDWITPLKIMNHRCSSRVVSLLNKIRWPVDQRQQRPRKDKTKGIVRLFLVKNTARDKRTIEKDILSCMAVYTGDEEWKDFQNVKTLILEHHMAASRLGFSDLFEALSSTDKLKAGLARGDLSGLTFFSNTVLPITKAIASKDDFGLMALLRTHSPLLNPKLLIQSEVDILKQMEKVKFAVDELTNIISSDSAVTFFKILQCIRSSFLLSIPNVFKDLNYDENFTFDASEDIDPVRKAWLVALRTQYKQIESYKNYIEGNAEFDTHHGVKGLQFKRVFVIMDDKESKGSSFSYEKLFGAREGSKPTDTTRRLFYVTCSRAEESLALVAYTENPETVRDFVVAEEWFKLEEIVIIN